ncbi:MAG: NAD-dependent epimerase/dehydratase family protein [Acidimicrobiales bacterium]
MRALVTGGAGFIGSALVDRLLAEGHEVDVVDDLSTGSLTNLMEARSDVSNPVRIDQLDICEPELVELCELRRPEVIFHLAAQASVPASVSDPLFDARVNVSGTVNVLEAARRAGTERIVFAASGGTLYGEPSRSELPVQETALHRPLSPYGVSKKAGIDYMIAYRKMHALEFSALALANVYGPRQDAHGESNVVAIFAQRLLNGQPVTIHGDGEQTRDFVYVDDVVDAFVRAAARGGGLVCNVSTGQATSVNEIYRLLAEAAGVDAVPEHGPERPGDVRDSSLDPGRASMQLGWKAWTPLDAGLAAVLGYFRGRAGTT